MAFMHGKGDDRVPDAPSFEELAEARERADAGHRIAFPQLFGKRVEHKEPVAEKAKVDHATATVVGTKLLDAHKSLMEAALALPLDGHADLHLAFNALVNEIDRISGELAERWGSE